MKKKILIALVVLCILITAGILYLNRVFLPAKVENLFIASLEEQTQKKVSLDSLQFSILRGLVIENLAISDEAGALFIAKKASCGFLILPFFKKEIVIPSLTLESCQIYIDRYSDNSFNLTDIFVKEERPDTPDQEFLLKLTKLHIKDSDVYFKDMSFSPVFSKQLERVDFLANLSLPANVKFSLNAKLASSANTMITAVGSYGIPGEDLSLDIEVSNLSPEEFSVYYQDLGVTVGQGSINAKIKVNLKDDLLAVSLEGEAKELALSKDELKTKLNSKFNADYKINPAEGPPVYSGVLGISDAEISGIEFIQRIEGVEGQVRFDNSGVYADNIAFLLMGFSCQGQFKIEDFTSPQAQIQITSELSLSEIMPILRDRFSFDIVRDMQGRAILNLEVKVPLSVQESLGVEGKLYFDGASIRIDQPDILISEISGPVEFTQSQIRWQDLEMSFWENQFKTSGSLTDFKAPAIELEVASGDLNFKAEAGISDKRAIISSCQGQYFASGFSLRGELDFQEPGVFNSNLLTTLDLELSDIIKFPFLKEQAKNLEVLKLKGRPQGKFKINGNIADIKSCNIEGALSCPAVSVYNLLGENFLLDYTQLNGIISLPLLHIALYGGSFDASARMNISSGELPFWAEINIQGLKLEELKLDTPMKDKELSGTLRAQAKLNGFSSDLSRLSGAGKLLIDQGNLWQINLFQGLGSILFTSDFNEILFHEGSCDFIVKDKYFYTDNLKLRGSLADLKGVMEIGFDGSIDAALDVQVSDEAPLTGTFRDVTTAIIGQARRFGEIKIEGTLAEPRYKFEASVVDIIRGVKDTFFKN